MTSEEIIEVLERCCDLFEEIQKKKAIKVKMEERNLLAAKDSFRKACDQAIKEVRDEEIKKETQGGTNQIL